MAGLLLVGLPLLVFGVVVLSRDGEPVDDAPPRVADLIAECAQGGAFADCDDRVAELQSVLKNAATAEESYAVGNKGRYTRVLAELKAEGLQLPPGVELRVVGPVRDGYCIEAQARGVRGTMHYSSTTGSPEEGTCG